MKHYDSWPEEKSSPYRFRCPSETDDQSDAFLRALQNFADLLCNRPGANKMTDLCGNPKGDVCQIIEAVRCIEANDQLLVFLDPHSRTVKNWLDTFRDEDDDEQHSV